MILIVPAKSIQGIVSIPSIQAVFAVSRPYGVITRIAIDQVIAILAIKPVVAGARPQRVAALAAAEEVIKEPARCVAANQRVVTSAADQVIVGVTARYCIIAAHPKGKYIGCIASVIQAVGCVRPRIQPRSDVHYVRPGNIVANTNGANFIRFR